VLQIPRVAAQSDLGSLRYDLSYLRRQVEGLDAEVRRLGDVVARNYQSSSPPRQNNTPSIVHGEPLGRSDPMFERLSTLVIELKQDFKTLEQRVTQLEKKFGY
jgi:hypothetical protein